MFDCDDIRKKIFDLSEVDNLTKEQEMLLEQLKQQYDKYCKNENDEDDNDNDYYEEDDYEDYEENENSEDDDETTSQEKWFWESFLDFLDEEMMIQTKI